MALDIRPESLIIYYPTKITEIENDETKINIKLFKPLRFYLNQLIIDFLVYPKPYITHGLTPQEDAFSHLQKFRFDPAISN